MEQLNIFLIMTDKKIFVQSGLSVYRVIGMQRTLNFVEYRITNIRLYFQPFGRIPNMR